MDLTRAFEMADIREAYCKSHKPCPKCKDPQVQLVASQPSHGDWKCRRCAHKWQTTLITKEKFRRKKTQINGLYMNTTRIIFNLMY